MKLSIIPAVVIPARFEVSLWEDSQHRDLLVEPTPYDTRLRADVQAWVDAHDPSMTMMVDRGDFGEGTAAVTLSFSSQAAAEAFHKAWNDGLCISETYLACPNMRKCGPRQYECAHCGAGYTTIDPRTL